MGLNRAVEDLGRIELLDQIVDPLNKMVKTTIKAGFLKDFLSGTWLEHPLHPLLTDITIGSVTSAGVIDLIGGERGEKAADALVALGLASAIPTALAGAADWSDTYGEPKRIGAVHAMTNAAGLGLYAWSLVARRRRQRTKGVILGMMGMSVMTIGGYLGGHMSFGLGIGVNNSFFHEHPEEWTALLADSDLPQRTPTRADTYGTTVLLYRDGDQILAIDSRCSHAGGHLEDGSIDEHSCTVKCPLHHSVFRLGDGSVVHGPATTPQMSYETRTRDGRIEVRYRR